MLEGHPMSKPVIRAIALGAFAAVAAMAVACGGDDDADDPTAAPSTPGVTQAASTEPAGETPTGDPTSEGIAVGETPASTDTPAAGGATVQAGAAGLVDSGGFSLYIFGSDVADSGQSACVAGCASAWPPLVDEAPTAGPGVTGALATITRADGSVQVTYNGKPLYRWINDANPGDTTGTAIMNWTLAQP